MDKILVVVDMQNDFIDGSLGTEEAQEIVPKVAEKIKNFYGEIFVTLDTHHRDYLNTQEGKMLPVEHCIIDTDGYCLNQQIESALRTHNFIPISKHTFGSTELANLVGFGRIKESFEIEIIGLCTDICVVSNALILKAYYPDARITVDSSCCAGVTPEKHKAALEVMRSCQINVI